MYTQETEEAQQTDRQSAHKNYSLSLSLSPTHTPSSGVKTGADDLEQETTLCAHRNAGQNRFFQRTN